MTPRQDSAGTRPEPPGLERRILRRLPVILIAGTALPAVAAFALRWWPAVGAGAAETAKRLHLIDALALGIVIVVWTAVVTVAIGCIVVAIMKGPVQMADPYNVPDRDRPGPPRGDAP